MKELHWHPTRGGMGLVILILLTVVVGLALFIYYQRKGPLSEGAKNRIELQHEIDSILSDLGNSYAQTQKAIQVISDTLRENGNNSNEDFNRVFREWENGRDYFLTQALGPEKTMQHTLNLANQLYRTHDLTSENLRTIDALNDQIRRNTLFNAQLVEGRVTAETFVEWNRDASRFNIVADRIKTDLGLH